MTTPRSMYDLFESRAVAHPDYPFLAVPPRMSAEWGVPEELSYGEALTRIDAIAEAFSARGYGAGDVIALALESRPEQFLVYLALNSIGACAVPINTELSTNEIGHVLRHSGSTGIIALPEVGDQLREAAHSNGVEVPVSTAGAAGLRASDPARTRLPKVEDARHRPIAILYTSGTSGTPKGCVITNAYALKSGKAYGSPEPALTLRPGVDRVLNPLPMFHMNTLMMTAGGVIDRGACLIVPGRFSLRNWWEDVRATRATRIHYLGLMIPALLTLPESPHDIEHQVVSAFGAGVDEHARLEFEKRYGIPLVEVWGMTETGRGLYATSEALGLGNHVCGRPQAGVEARIEREDGTIAPDGEAGELVVRDASENPRDGFFSGYLGDPEETENAWRGGWFHTGDVFTRDGSGIYTFIDRRKNIVRRSGENISSAEVEAALIADDRIAHVAVVPILDSMRGEEVLACVVPWKTEGTPDVARAIVRAARERIAHFKIPGWIRFVDELPTTSTQKVLKHLLVPDEFDERVPPPYLHDCRDLKARIPMTQEEFRDK